MGYLKMKEKKNELLRIVIITAAVTVTVIAVLTLLKKLKELIAACLSIDLDGCVEPDDVFAGIDDDAAVILDEDSDGEEDTATATGI